LVCMGMSMYIVCVYIYAHKIGASEALSGSSNV
jgi:hypothetical protein